jgi:hypothetical protein
MALKVSNQKSSRYNLKVNLFSMKAKPNSINKNKFNLRLSLYNMTLNTSMIYTMVYHLNQKINPFNMTVSPLNSKAHLWNWMKNNHHKNLKIPNMIISHFSLTINLFSFKILTKRLKTSQTTNKT